MTKEEDYRNSDYCPVLKNVQQKKQLLEDEIRGDSARTRIFYNKVNDRKGKYHEKFANIYNKKCAYCGIQWGLFPVESFEVDHFVNEASFPKTVEGRENAGKVSNLVWSCISCNRGKSALALISPYDKILNVDDGSIAKVFERDEQFYIRIRDRFKNDEFVKKFYDELHLGYEARRLDYLLLKMQGMYERELDEGKKARLGESIYLLQKKRNTMIESKDAI